MKKIILIVVLNLLLVFFLCYKSGLIFRTEAITISNTNQADLCGQGEGCTLKKETYVGYNVGEQFPNIILTDVSGSETHLYDLVEGHERFILSLTADWCSDCKRQNAKLTEYYSELEEQGLGAAVMYVNYSSADGSKTTNELQIVDFINEMNYTFPVFYDKNGNFISDYGDLSAVPYNFILDENAIIKGITTEVDADILFLENSETSQV